MDKQKVILELPHDINFKFIGTLVPPLLLIAKGAIDHNTMAILKN